MRIDEFKQCIDKLSFANIADCLYFTESKELFNPKNGQSTTFQSIEDLLNAKLNGVRISEIIESDQYEMLIEIDGGRGSRSEGQLDFTFGHAPIDLDGSRARFPAEFNDGEKFQSEDKALEKFREKHANSDKEFAIAVDEDGFVHQYQEGGTTAVAIAGRDGQLVIHNHPNDGAFSDGDLLSCAQNKGERGIIASGKSGDYIFKKGKNFNAEGFVKAVHTAKMRGTDYNDAVDKWLMKNRDKYGYEYEFRKA